MNKAGHVVSYFRESQFAFHATCKCGFRTKAYPTLQGAEDEVHSHEQTVERARAMLARRATTLKTEYRYYAAMAENPNISAKDREQWRRLAEGLAPRVTGQPVEDVALPGMEDLERSVPERRQGDRT